MKKYKVITLCGSTRFRREFEDIQKKLTLQGNIVISVGLFGHAGDNEVWDNAEEGTLSRTKEMLDDMHKEKIDMADEIYVINPGGYIGQSTWSEICYARMTDKKILSMEPINEGAIQIHVKKEIFMAKRYSCQQYDWYCHVVSDYPEGTIENDIVKFVHKGEVIIDPWQGEDNDISAKGSEIDPFKLYGKKKMARFISSIILKHQSNVHEDSRAELAEEVDWYINEIHVPEIPQNYPNMSIKEMEEYLACWRDYKTI